MIADNISLGLASFADAVTIATVSRDEIESGLPWSWTPARVERALRQRDVNVVVAKDANVLAGFGIMKYDDDGANLGLLAVTKAYRRRGTATRIVAWLEQVAVCAGLFDVTVQLRERNTVAKAFYEKLDFEVIDHVRAYYPHREKAIVMAKRLSVNTPTV